MNRSRIAEIQEREHISWMQMGLIQLSEIPHTCATFGYGGKVTHLFREGERLRALCRICATNCQKIHMGLRHTTPDPVHFLKCGEK